MDVQLIEVVWVAIMLTGSGFGIANMLNSRKDLKLYLSSGKNGVGQFVTGAIFRVELRRVIVQLLLLSIGIIAFFEPPGEDPRDTGAYLIVGGLILAGCTLSYNSWATWRFQRRLREIVAEDELAIDEKGESNG